MSQIELQDALVIMESGDPVSFVAVKYDRNRKIGGQIMKFDNATLVGKQSTTGILKFRTPSGEVRAVHQRLITEFNNQKVIW